MYNLETYRQLTELFHKYGLGDLTEEPKQVTGGLMHKMYSVATVKQRYAVKEFNATVMQRDGVVQNIINSERIACALKHQIPLITAIQFADTSLIWTNNRYYMIFDWSEGNSIYPPQILAEHCTQIGALLGKIHTADIHIPGLQKEMKDTKLIDWDTYLQSGLKAKAMWVHELARMSDRLYQWSKECKAACQILCEKLVLSHRDIDPKNVLWKEGSPYLIDWEAAGYVNPYQELLEVLNYWSDSGNGELDKDKFDALNDAYRAVAGNHPVDWNRVLACGYGGMLGWLDYSLKRSLGIEAVSPEEVKLGTEQVIATLKALLHYDQQRVILMNWLDN